MPLFEVRGPQDLVPFRQLRGGADLYERQIEDLFWVSPEELTGEALFRIARQPNVGGGRPDIVALDREANVVVAEVKRDVDRAQLAQCLEYAGWARTASLDSLAAIYHGGPDAFFRDWQEFMDSPTPVRISRSPRLILIARDLDSRTGPAIDFLIENQLPVKLVRVSVYEDQQGRRFVDVEGEHEPEFTIPAPAELPGHVDRRVHPKLHGRRVRLTDLLDADLIASGTVLFWERPRVGQVIQATVRDDGSIELQNGRRFSSPSRAATEAAGVGAYDGWEVWRVGNPDGPLLHELRERLIAGVDGRAEAEPAFELEQPVAAD